MQKFLVVLVLFIFFEISMGFCPKFIKCETSEDQNSCPGNQFYRKSVKVHGCCPGCVTLKGENESCQSPAECEPGLTCRSSKQCEKDPTQACEYYRRFDYLFNKVKYWNPVCLTDGAYAPKQCKGEKLAGKCFCVNKIGERIFGEEEWSKAMNMTCGCSLLVESTEKTKTKVIFHCDHLGNFEPFQCDQKVCWCANPTTGTPYTLAVPLETAISLPCYNREAVGAQYYRQCDSMENVLEGAKSLLRNHGTTKITLMSLKCNYDGSYHRVQVSQGKKRCVFFDNSYLTDANSLSVTTCNCAYDKHVAQLQQTEFWAECLPNGEYNNRMIWEGKVFCIDKDGFYYSNHPSDCPIQSR